MDKKILTVGYYADFSRFFKKIANETQKIDHRVRFLHINLFLSGYLYSLTHRQKSVYLPFKRCRTTRPNIRSKNFYRQFIAYHKILLPSIDESKLLIQTEKYYHYLDELISDYQPDLIILSGDSRMPAEIIHYLAREKQTNIVFFEQAPLGRTIIDHKGVNANSSFRVFGPENINTHISEEYQSLRMAKSKEYKIFRIVDLIIEKFFPQLLPIEQRRPVRVKIDNLRYHQLMKGKVFTESTGNSLQKLLLVLQVPDDVNMIYHSPWFATHYDIVNAVAENMPDNAVLIVREHPLFRQLYESELYNYILNHPRVFIDNSGSLDSAISNSHLVVVNNSTVGLESIEKGKKVLVLGNSYYDSAGLCYKYNGSDLKSLILKALQDEVPDAEYRKKYLGYLFNHVFIPGHFRDKDGPAPKEIAKWIVKNV